METVCLFISLHVSTLYLFHTLQSPTQPQIISESKPDHDIGHRYVLQAAFDDNLCSLKVAYLAKKKTALHLVIIEGRVDQSRADHAGQWSESVMKAVYDGEINRPP